MKKMLFALLIAQGFMVAMQSDLLNSQDDQGKTPLHYAVELAAGGQEKTFNIVTQLLAAGADVTIKDNNNQTVLDYAAEMKNEKLYVLLEAAYKQKNEKLPYSFCNLI